jgi:hypothetical protein
MSYEKFGRERHRPAGDWVQATYLLEVAGWTFRKANVERFFAAVRKAEASGTLYGVRVRPEPDNAHDPCAIAVDGFALVKRWFRSPMLAEWHLGYVPVEEAAKIHQDLLANGTPIEGELYSLYARDDYREMRFFVLAPPGNGVEKRRRAREAPR